MLHTPQETLSRCIRYRGLTPETHGLYNLKLWPPASQEALERLVVLTKNSARNSTDLFVKYNRATADIFDLLAVSNVSGIDSGHPSSDVSWRLGRPDSSWRITQCRCISCITPVHCPKCFSLPYDQGPVSAECGAQSASAPKPMSNGTTLRARRNEHRPSDEHSFMAKAPNHDWSIPSCIAVYLFGSQNALTFECAKHGAENRAMNGVNNGKEQCNGHCKKRREERCVEQGKMLCAEPQVKWQQKLGLEAVLYAHIAFSSPFSLSRTVGRNEMLQGINDLGSSYTRSTTDSLSKEEGVANVEPSMWPSMRTTTQYAL